MLLTTLFNILLSMAQANPTATVPCPTGDIKRHGKVKRTEITTSGLIVTTVGCGFTTILGMVQISMPWIQMDKQYSIQVHEAYARDWEEMTPFTDGDKQYFLIGDIGDNKNDRTISFYVIDRPSSNTTSPLLCKFANYAEIGAKDAGFVVDPSQMLLITKGEMESFTFLKRTSHCLPNIQPVLNPSSTMYILSSPSHFRDSPTTTWYTSVGQT